MANIQHNEELAFNDSIKVSEKGNPILGVLEGPCADIIEATRNGRKYDDSLWEKVFNDDIIKEYFECGGIFGELGHPVDRTETDMEKICICMPKPPVKGKDGALQARFDILDTPNGRIAYTLAKYGYKLGVSSRGSGDTYTGSDGEEHVDEDTYDFQAFDLVLLPAVKKARLNLVSESLDTNKSFSRAICEALEKSTSDEQKIMKETLESLHIDYTSANIDADKSDIDNNIKVDNPEDTAIDDRVAIKENLQILVKENKQLHEQISELNTLLSVSNAKELKLTEELSKYKSAIISLADQAKIASALKTKVTTLEEKLKTQSKQVFKLEEANSRSTQSQKQINNSLASKSQEINALNETINVLKAKERDAERNHNQQIAKLTEELTDLKKDSAIKNSEYSEKLNQQAALVEKYKKVARVAINKYIDTQATKLGISASEIKARLNENYSFTDIDAICKELEDYKINVSKLPFNISSSSKIKINESKNNLPQVDTRATTDDTVDDQLVMLAKIK